MDLKVEVTLPKNWRDLQSTVTKAVEIAARNEGREGPDSRLACRGYVGYFQLHRSETGGGIHEG